MENPAILYDRRRKLIIAISALALVLSISAALVANKFLIVPYINEINNYIDRPIIIGSAALIAMIISLSVLLYNVSKLKGGDKNKGRYLTIGVIFGSLSISIATMLSTGMLNGMIDDKILNAFDFMKNGFSEMEKLWKDGGWVGKTAPIVIVLLLLAVLFTSIAFIVKGLINQKISSATLEISFATLEISSATLKKLKITRENYTRAIEMYGSYTHFAITSRQLSNVPIEIIKRDLNTQNKKGLTPFHLSASRSWPCDLMIMETLLNNEADIEGTDKDGKTPLYHVVKSLCDLMNGKTPLYRVVKISFDDDATNFKKCVEFLLLKGAKVTDDIIELAKNHGLNNNLTSHNDHSDDDTDDYKKINNYRNDLVKILNEAKIKQDGISNSEQQPTTSAASNEREPHRKFSINSVHSKEVPNNLNANGQPASLSRQNSQGDEKEIEGFSNPNFTG